MRESLQRSHAHTRESENETTAETIRSIAPIHAANDNEASDNRLEKLALPEQISHLSEIVEVVEKDPQIRAVTFDMFDTLVQWNSVKEERAKESHERMSQWFKEHGVEISGEELQLKRSEAKKPYESTKEWKQGGEYRMEDIFADMCSDLFADSLPKEGRERTAILKQYAKELEHIVATVDGDTATVMPGAKETLEKLKEFGCNVGVVSNFTYSGDVVKGLLRRFGLLDLLDSVIVSSEVGARKSASDPEGRIFKRAARALGVEDNLSGMIHVGDNERADRKGPARIGLHGIVYDNPDSSQKRLGDLVPGMPEYAPTCLEIQREALIADAGEYFDHYESKNGVKYPESFKADCLKMYESSLDAYGPVLVKFSERNLDLLKNDEPGSINLCTGRDALAMFLIQRKLIETFPEKYGDLGVNRVQFLPVSRKMILESESDKASKLKNPEEAVGYLRDQLSLGRESSIDLDSVTAIRIVDSGVEGKLQDAFAKILPEKRVTGEYIMSNRTATGNPDTRRGFLVEAAKWSNTQNSGYEITGYPKLWNAEFLRKQEDLFNGIRVSPQWLEQRQGVLRPTKQSVEIQTTPPGRAQLMPGLEMEGGYELFKRIILKGLLDSVKVSKREAQLGVSPTVEDAAHTLEAWHIKSEQDPDLRRILNATVRKREHIN